MSVLKDLCLTMNISKDLQNLVLIQYEFSIRLSSVMPSQKALSRLIDMHDNPEEIDEFSHRIFDTVRDKGIDLDNILFEN